MNGGMVEHVHVWAALTRIVTDESGMRKRPFWRCALCGQTGYLIPDTA